MVWPESVEIDPVSLLLPPFRGFRFRFLLCVRAMPARAFVVIDVVN